MALPPQTDARIIKATKKEKFFLCFFPIKLQLISGVVDRTWASGHVGALSNYAFYSFAL